MATVRDKKGFGRRRKS